MLINHIESANEANVKFVSYTGGYPNLCSGILTLLIDGQEVKFGHDTRSYNWKTKKYNENNHDRFWSSGGICGFRNNGEEYVVTGEWEIDVDELPEQFRKYAVEIDRVFNANVPHGCCGGCL